MAISAALLPEFDHEMANTRKTLERVPDDKFEWRPHAKSAAMGGLATHLANLPSWAALAVTSDSFDIAPDGQQFRVPPAATQSELLEIFDKNVATARSSIADASDEELLKPWSLLSNGRTVMTLPRIAVVRGFVLNHSIHHRAQLGVYLRLNDLPVPSLYGPSADEGAF
ncbi:MAG: DinB family protein [Acidobacteriota bacterium]